MPGYDPNRRASDKQLQFCWNLVQGAHEMQLAQYLPPEIQTQEAASQTFRNGMSSVQASQMIENLIFQVGAVPPGSRTDRAGNQKIASEKQVGLYNTIAQELAQMGDAQWSQHQMQGRYSWTVSKWIKRLQDAKASMEKQSQQQCGQAPAQQQPWGQQPQQQWGQPAQPAQAPAPQPAAQWGQPAQQPGFDAQGNPIQPGVDNSPPFV